MPYLTAESLPRLLKLENIDGEGAPQLIRAGSGLKSIELFSSAENNMAICCAFTQVQCCVLEVIKLVCMKFEAVDLLLASLKAGFRKLKLCRFCEKTPALSLDASSTVKDVMILSCSNVDEMLACLSISLSLRFLRVDNCEIKSSAARYLFRNQILRACIMVADREIHTALLITVLLKEH